jgi:4-amino-4-deoxy-L-arabinose transferase-like glycosyltransferase
VPAPLVALLGVALLLGVAWALVTPPFQAPDENAHFGYVQSLAERFALPGDPKRPIFSTEQALASSLSNADQAPGDVDTKMEWSANAYHRWQALDARLPASGRSNGGGPNPAQANPPLYYLYEAGAYRLAEGGNVLTRLEVTRLASVVWMLVTVTAVWLLAGEAFGRDRLLQTAAAGVPALAPMVGFVSASVSPDAMLYAAWSVVLWLGVRLLRRGATPARAGALLAATGLACVVKATSYALLPAVALALVVGLHRARPLALRRGLTIAGGAAAGLVMTLGVWIAVAHALHRAAAAQVGQVAGGTRASLSVRGLGSYLWQFYLPRLSFQHDFGLNAPVVPAYDIWFKQSWAAFGWLEVTFPGFVYVVLLVGSVAVIAAALVALWRARRTVDWAPVAFLALAVLVLFAGLHWTEYRYLAARLPQFNSGRYLLPMIGAAGLVFGQSLTILRPPARRVAVAAAFGCLFALDVAALALMLGRFYV